MIFDAGAKLKTPSEIFPPLRIYADVPGMLVKEYVYVWLCFAQPLENQKRTYVYSMVLRSKVCFWLQQLL